MRASTPCPDPIHLRLFFYAPAHAIESNSLRAHVEQCETCRAIVGELQGDYEPQRAQTERFVVRGQEPSSAESTVILPPPNGAVQVEAGDHVEHTLSDASLEEPGDASSSLAESTVILPAEKPKAEAAEVDANQNTIADGTLAAGRPRGSSTDTGEFILSTGDDPSNSAADTSILLPPGASAGDESLGFSESTPAAKPGEESAFAATLMIAPGSGSIDVAPTGKPAPSLWRDDSDDLEAGATPLRGVTVPGYDILEELGRGGMGVVYKARHRRLQRLVALKMVLAGAHVGHAGLARFRAEAEAVAKLLHSNIVQIYETGEHEGRPYFSLEYVDGGSLAQRISETPPRPRAAAKLVETLARTMDVAHQRGIVHRDLKPANILLATIASNSSMVREREDDSATLPADHWSRNTVPKIADFGLAKRVDEDSSQTQSGTILGTPSYMAPEQAGGKNREIGPAADIYSLGAILYELLVGRPPFKAGNPIDTVRQVIEQEPVPPRQLEPRSSA